MYIDILIEQLKKVNDLDKNKGKRHELWLILIITILACMCGYTSYRAIGDFANSNN
ncbi:MAG: transposase family protein [Gomphosphaeria aponina SAG 52.96 = DSM 107014]|uniref:Transposase family protein n=1 Tax=Gomphosphaeria aponina SAG 52.96 = DSM 107014 TaxID=1521640 RepID=A0A941GQ25_9CHRO|nr:transposase family protein [Gomphosphaeria aponina SAG 52.96 = DSM 107014]